MRSRILVAEDSPTQAEALRALLEECGYEVEVARSAEEALERVAEREFDLLLSDIMMPGMTGCDLCREIKQDPRSRELPVVLLTSLADPMDIIRGLECGADNYITKPYEPEHLLARLRRVLDNRRFRADAKTSLGVSVRFLGKDLRITSEKEQILDLFIASVEEVIRANEALQQRERELAEAHARLEVYASQKEREAHLSTERYATLLQNAGDAILVLDGEGRILDANRRAIDLFGHGSEDLVSRPVHTLVPEEERAELLARFRRLPADRQASLGERRFVDREGREVWCELRASSNPLGGEDMVLLIARDVTERRRTHLALWESNQRLTMLIDASPLPIVAVDREGAVTLWNRAAERTFGWTVEEVAGRPPRIVTDDCVDEFRTLHRRVLGGEHLTGVETRRTRRDGTPLEVSIHAAPLSEPGGGSVGAMAVVTDITERKRAEAAIHEREEADRANRAKSTFLSRMSHELRTPLSAILGFGQLLEAEPQREEDRESVEQILHAGRHLLALIDEVLDLAKVEAGSLALSTEPVPVGELVRESLALVQPMAAERRIVLQAEDAIASGAWAMADRQRLKQVLLNLLSNAIKYNRAGGSIAVACEEAPGGRPRVSVVDTGPGIPAELLPRLFVPFDRLRADRGEVEGTGLGLVLSKSLVEAMDGSLGVESTFGRGSRFWVDLPPAEAPEASERAPCPASSELLRDAGGRGYTILFVEDNLANVRLIGRLFQRRPNVKLLSAMQGSLGLELARRHRPDLILLDLNLPDLNGDEVLLRLQEEPGLREIPVVMLSGDAIPAQVERLRALGARGYLTKPFDLNELLAVTDELLGGARG